MIKFAAGLLIGVILLGGIWYFYWLDSEEVTAPLPPPSWENAMVDIKSALVINGDIIEERSPLRIMEKTDLTGDGFPEALIDIGSGGASTVYMAVMRMEDRKPALVQLKDKNGEVFKLSGWPIGASAMHGQDMELVSNRNAITLGAYSIDGRSADITLEECRNEAYIWKSALGMFEWDSELSEETTQTYCENIKSRIQAR